MGIILSIPAIILLSIENTNEKERKDHITRSLKYGLGSGIFFGGFFILLSQTSDDSGLWPLLFAKTGNILIVFIILMLRKNNIKLQPHTKRITILSGFIDMMGNIFFFLHERLTHVRIAGILLSITGAALIGIGG